MDHRIYSILGIFLTIFLSLVGAIPKGKRVRENSEETLIRRKRSPDLPIRDPIHDYQLHLPGRDWRASEEGVGYDDDDMGPEPDDGTMPGPDDGTIPGPDDRQEAILTGPNTNEDDGGYYF